MFLLVGLGNPEQEHTLTRHNAGFLVIDKIAEKLKINFKFIKKFNAEITEIKFKQKKIFLAKPQTFMNLSGQSILAIKKFYKINLENIIVIHDDKDIELGKYKIQIDRGSAGHNGVKSIIDILGTKNFWRIRIGIKPYASIKDTAKFVLMKFTKKELETISTIADDVFNNLYTQIF